MTRSFRSIFSVAAMAIGLLAVTATASAQQLKSRDIVGVKLGASEVEVEAALNAFNPKLKLSKKVFRAEPGQAGGVAEISTTSDVIGIQMGGLPPRPKEDDTFTIQFAETTGKVVAITRIHTVDLGGTPFSMNVVTAAMSEKYGYAWTFKSHETFGVGLSAGGKPDQKCIDGEGAGGNRRLVGCGDSFTVRFANGPGNGLYTWYLATLVDSAAAIEDIKASNAKREAASQAANRKAQDAARAAKPAI